MKLGRISFAILAVAALAAISFLPLSHVHATGPTALTPVTLKLNNYQVQAGDLTVTPAACDNVNGNAYTFTGTEILLVQNTDTAAHTFSVSNYSDNYGATNTTLTGYSIAASTIDLIQMSSYNGWVSGGVVTLACNSNLVKFAVLRHS